LSTKINKKLILSRIKKHYNFKNDAELARFFEIAPTTLSSWNSRGSINWDMVFSKCVEMDFNVLIKGIAPQLPGATLTTPTPETIMQLMQYIEVKDKQNESLAEKVGELKYENKLLRKKLGYNNNLAADSPEK
jgi:hypothetical protein